MGPNHLALKVTARSHVFPARFSESLWFVLASWRCQLGGAYRMLSVNEKQTPLEPLADETNTKSMTHIFIGPYFIRK